MSPAPAPIRASLIVPAFREGPNIKNLVERTFTAASNAGVEAEMIIVDDNSQDETEAVVQSLSGRFPVRLIVRRDERGLSRAVLAGFAEARHEHLVVMDADLQHPPEQVPDLVMRLAQGDCDFVIGTRYAHGSTIAESWPWRLRLNSKVASWLAGRLTPLSDPMSGFFALHRRTWAQADRLDPVGYKIALELYVKGHCRRPAEVPIRFDTRAAGESKNTLAERLRYLRHLWRLYRYRFPLLARLGAVLAAVALALCGWMIVRHGLWR